MTDERRRELIEHSLKRARGLSPERREALDQELAAADDWYVFCRACGQKRVGTVEQLKQECGCAQAGS